MVLHIPGKPLLHPLADSAVTFPGKPKIVKNPAELLVIHTVPEAVPS
jgi:hypothetical protein